VIVKTCFNCLIKTVRSALLVLLVFNAGNLLSETTQLTHNSILRKSATISSSNLGTLLAGTDVSLISTRKRGGYYHVNLQNGRSGWVLAKNVSVSQPNVAHNPAPQPRRPARAPVAAAPGQSFSVTRSSAIYHPSNAVDPATLMSQANFLNSAGRDYVVVEGYIDYVAGTISDTTHTTRVGTEADGDFHFEMQSTNAPRPGGENPNGLVCEIDPPLQLAGWNALSQIDRKVPQTYRKVRVYGWLRFGTEKAHSGVRDYTYAAGKIISGHWEIHPVEKIETIDSGPSFKIGPSANYASWPIANRYKVTNTNFGVVTQSNYAVLKGKVSSIQTGSDQSGDLYVGLQIGNVTYTATIPQYYVASFDAATQTANFVHLPNFATIGYSLAPSSTRVRTFYGLKNWKFRQGRALPALQPVEMIK
jgi:hypothetical protein